MVTLVKAAKKPRAPRTAKAGGAPRTAKAVKSATVAAPAPVQAPEGFAGRVAVPLAPLAPAQKPAAPPADNPGGVESLDALGLEAQALQSGVEGQGAQAVQQVQQQQAVQQAQQTAAAAQEVAELLGVVRTMAAPLVEGVGYLKPGQTKAIWRDEVLAAAAVPLVQIMQRHGVGMAELFAQWGPYAMLFVSVAPPALATIHAVRENRAERAAMEHAAVSAGGDKPAGDAPAAEGASGGQQ